MQLKIAEPLRKTLFIMKLTILLLTLACLHASAIGFGQTVTLSFKNVALEKVFKEIKKQTNYSFIYTRDQLKNTKLITCEIKDGQLKDILDLCFRDQPLSFLIEDRYIIVLTKTNTTPTVVVSQKPIKINGRVVNENGEPVERASVFLKGTTIGTITDENGEFSMDIPAPDVILVITSVNIEPIEVKTNGQTDLPVIRVKTLIRSLDAVLINKGYYKTSQRLNTGSVFKVSSEDISRQPVSNAIAALEGRVPGLLIIQRNGLPGSNFSIQIRGQNSIQQGNDPLFIIDGVPFAPDNLAKLATSTNVTNPFTTINPADIESIEILKDADATAIYGSRGANGVVLITTKRARAGKTSVEANFYTGWGRATRTMDYLNTVQYLQMRNEALRNDGVIANASNAPDLKLWDTTRYTDWKGILTDGTSNITNSQLRFSTGNKYINYLLSAGYYTESTVFPGDFIYKRGSVSLNVSGSSADKRFNSIVSASYVTDKNKLGNEDLTFAFSLPPNMYSPYDASGKLQWSEGGFSYGNPFSVLQQTYNANSDRLIANVNLNYKIFNKIIVRTNFNYNNIQFDQYSIRPVSSQNPAFNPKGSANFNYTSSKTWNIEPQAEYSEKINAKGLLQFLLGTTFQQKKDDGIFINGSGYTNDAQITSVAGAAAISIQNDYALYRYASVYGRMNFSWDEKYLFNIVARRDASSRFGTGKRFANFGAVGLAWVFSNEKFIKKLSFINYGKIRASYGITGNDRIGDYQYLETWANTNNSYQNQLGLRPSRLFNENYKWEQLKKLNVGFDLALFKDRVSITIDWFRHKSSNQLILYSLPDQTGFSSIIRNIPAVIQNKGVEFLLTTEIIRKNKFTWRNSFSITVLRNKLLEFYGLANSSYASRYIIGKPLSLLIGYTYNGLDPQTGIYQFADLNRDGILNTADYSYQGTTIPDFYGGFVNTIRYKNFELQVFFEFRKQLGRHAIFGSSNTPGSFINQPVDVLDRWQKPGDIATYQQYTQSSGTPVANAAGRITNSGAVLTDASFIRLKNLSLSYTLSDRLLQKLKMEKLNLFLQGQNLLTLTNYVGADPENQNIRSLPPLRVLAFGFNITF